MRGAAFVTLRMDDQMRAVGAAIPPHLDLCLVDATAAQTVQRLAGSEGCETETPELQHVRSLPFAGRQWEVRISAARADLPDVHSADVWPFALVGLFSIAMLGGFLLIITGRAHRIEIAVHERTVALRAEAREREIAETAMRESEQRFRNILNSVPIGVIYSDLKGAVKQTNPRFLELTGYSESESLTLGLADYTHPEDLPQDIALLAQLVRGEIPMFRRQERYITKLGAEIRVQVTVSVLRDAGDKPRSIVGVVEDITEHLQLEEAERAREAAEASNQAKSEFLSRMSHELRTPLNAMLGFAQLLEMDSRHPLATSQRPWVDQIQQAGWHLLEMINDVLDMSRIESGNLRLQIETLDLREVLAATVSMVEGDARKRGLVISQDLAPGTPTVLGDATRVKQILTNLLSNAVKYNIDAGRIHIGCRSAAAGLVELTVTDTGLGMTADQLAELFQPFNRLGRERSTHQGTGIGLVISQRLAELMGGTLKARSVAGQGSSFILSLPCSDDPDTVRSDLDSLRSVPAEYHGRLIHYVEDNETNVEVMRGILAQRPQVEMQVSMNGLDGVAGIRTLQPDLVLLDMNLPDISGIEVLQRLKADPRTADVPVVVVSADALADQIDAAFDAGCVHYLTKPVSVSELLSIVDHLLEQTDTRFGL
ncbi:MAG: ATP-binding protein [Burkholderiaceae bacterium]